MRNFFYIGAHIHIPPKQLPWNFLQVLYIKKTPRFRAYSRRALYDLPQTLHGDRARRASHEMCHPFFDPTYSFSYREHGKILPNLPTRGFSAITP